MVWTHVNMSLDTDRHLIMTYEIPIIALTLFCFQLCTTNTYIYFLFELYEI